MFEYHDYSYVNYVVKLPYDEFYQLYDKCISHKIDRVKQIDDDRLWQLFITNSEGGTFEDFKNSLKHKHTSSFQSSGDKDKEIERINKKSEKLRSLMEIEDKREKINKVQNVVVIGGK